MTLLSLDVWKRAAFPELHADGAESSLKRMHALCELGNSSASDTTLAPAVPPTQDSKMFIRYGRHLYQDGLRVLQGKALRYLTVTLFTGVVLHKQFQRCFVIEAMLHEEAWHPQFLSGHSPNKMQRFPEEPCAVAR